MDAVVTLLSTSCDVKALNVARLRNLIIGYVQMTAPLYFGLHAGAYCANSNT